MTEQEFLDLVASLAPKFQQYHDTGAAWEIAAQCEIAVALKKTFGIAKPREISYAGSQEKCDFGFTHNGVKIAVELKVEAPDGKFGGSAMGASMVGDVNKLHAFQGADESWFVVVAVSARARRILMAQLDRGDSWIGAEADGIAVALCNIDTMPHGMTWEHVSEETLAADRSNVRGHGFV